jgi:hypothetical protein
LGHAEPTNIGHGCGTTKALYQRSISLVLQVQQSKT